MDKKIYFTGVLIVIVLMMSFIIASAVNLFTEEAKSQFKNNGEKIKKIDSKKMCEKDKLKQKDKQNKKCDINEVDVPEGFGIVLINKTFSPTNKEFTYIYNE